MGPRYKVEILGKGSETTLYCNGSDHMEVIVAELQSRRKMPNKMIYMRVSGAKDDLPSPTMVFR